MKLPGCKRGPHTAAAVAAPAAAESSTIQRLKAAADATPAPAPSSSPAAIPVASLAPVASAAPASYDLESCPRCRQGFACQEHGVSVAQAQANVAAKKAAAKAALLADPKRPRACKNAGCGVQYVPGDQVPNSAIFHLCIHNELRANLLWPPLAVEQVQGEAPCCYHPGPPVFHDAAKKWGCCNKSRYQPQNTQFLRHVRNEVIGICSHDFDEWMKFPGCARGPHAS